MSLFTLINARGESVDILNDNLLAYSPTGLGVNFSNTYSQYENYFKNTKSQVAQGQMSVNIMFGDIESVSYQTFSQFGSFLNYQPLTLVYSTDSGTWSRDAKTTSLTKSEIGGTSVLQTDRLVEVFTLEFINPWYNNKEGKYKSYDADPNLALYGKGYFNELITTQESINYWSLSNKIDGKLLYQDGGVAQSASGLTAYNPNYFNVTKGQIIWTTIYDTVSTNNKTLAGRIIYYDKDKNFISCTSDIPITQGSYKNIAPTNSAYFRISLFKYTDIRIKVEIGTTATDWTPAPEDDPTQTSQTWNYGYQEFIN